MSENDFVTAKQVELFIIKDCKRLTGLLNKSLNASEAPKVNFDFDNKELLHLSENRKTPRVEIDLIDANRENFKTQYLTRTQELHDKIRELVKDKLETHHVWCTEHLFHNFISTADDLDMDKGEIIAHVYAFPKSKTDESTNK